MIQRRIFIRNVTNKADTNHGMYTLDAARQRLRFGTGHCGRGAAICLPRLHSGLCRDIRQVDGDQIPYIEQI